MDKFSAHIKESLEKVNTPDYNPDHFKAIEAELDAKQTSGNQSRMVKVFGSAAIIAGAVAFLTLSPSEEVTVNEGTVVETTVSQEQKAPVTEDTKVSTKKEPTNTRTEVESMPQVSAEKEVVLPLVEERSESEPQVEELPETRKDKKPVQEDLVASVYAEKLNGCAYEPMSFFSEVEFPATYLWSFGDGFSSKEPNPTHAYNRPGTYKVRLMVTSLVDGRHKNLLLEKDVVVKGQPKAEIEYAEVAKDAFNRKMQFSIGGADVVEWEIDGEKSLDMSPEKIFYSKGDYRVRAIVKSSENCFDTVFTTVKIEKLNNLLAPTAFSPNGDGRNDNFIPKALENGATNFTMNVVNAMSGKTVYRGENDLEGWNGNDMNSGERCAKGTYVWVVVVTKPDGSTDSFKGNVTLVE